MKIELDKEDIKRMFGPLGYVPGVKVYGVDEKGKKVDFESIVVEAKFVRKMKMTKTDEEAFSNMFG